MDETTLKLINLLQSIEPTLSKHYFDKEYRNMCRKARNSLECVVWRMREQLPCTDAVGVFYSCLKDIVNFAPAAETTNVVAEKAEEGESTGQAKGTGKAEIRRDEASA